MKVKSKEYFEVNYSFAKPFSQNFEVLIPRSDDINPNLGQKRAQTCTSCTNCGRKMKIQSKRNFEVKYSFMKFFSQNLEIQAPCCDVIISKLAQKDSMRTSCSTGGKTIQIIFF